MTKANESILRKHLSWRKAYLKGYLNVNYPPTEYTIQRRSVADRYEGITQLRLKRGAIDELQLSAGWACE